jgi:hypothetical protein
MGRLFAAAALILGVLALHAAAAGALPIPSRGCGTIGRGVPLRPARLQTLGYPPPSCRTARRVMRRFLRTHARRVLGWSCEEPFTSDDGRTFYAGYCVRGPANDERTIEAFLPLPHTDP